MKNYGLPSLAVAFALAVSFGAAAAGAVEPPYPALAPIERYRSATLEDEISLARSAAPPSISRHAEVLALGDRAYAVVARGTNGFACIVERSWGGDLTDKELWNPKIRAPICFNAPAARSVLPEYLLRTQWVLAGASRAELIRRARAAVASRTVSAPETGSMCYMLSKRGYLTDTVAGPWRAHIMFFLPRTPEARWGANEPGSPLIGFHDDIEPLTVFLVPVAKWSDGTLSAWHAQRR